VFVVSANPASLAAQTLALWNVKLMEAHRRSRSRKWIFDDLWSQTWRWLTEHEKSSWKTCPSFSGTAPLMTLLESRRSSAPIAKLVKKQRAVPRILLPIVVHAGGVALECFISAAQRVSGNRCESC